MADRLMRHLLLPLFLVALWPAGLDAVESDRLKKQGFLVQEGLVESPGFSTEDATGNDVDFASFPRQAGVAELLGHLVPPVPSGDAVHGNGCTGSSGTRGSRSSP